MSSTHGRSTRHAVLPKPLVAFVVAALAGTMLAGCASSGSGPTAGGLERSANRAYPGTLPVVELGEMALPNAPSGSTAGLASLGGSKFNGNVLRPGDTINVRIFDTGEEGLISSTNSKQLELGTFRIEENGQVNLPFVGRVRAAGSSASALQDRIAGGLRGSSVSPQASVYVTEASGTGFTVNGAVTSAGRFTLTNQSERVLDAVAMAGGPSAPAGESEVTLVRGSQRATVSMDRLIAEPAQNVHVQPDDQIFVRRQASSFTSFGAFKSPGEFNFQPGDMTLAQAVARSGGLLDDRANPRKVYVLRQESPSVARSLGTIPVDDVRTAPVPMVYAVDMTKTPSLFEMQSFQMQKGDMLYVPNAGSANIGKAFQIFQKSPPTAAAPLPE